MWFSHFLCLAFTERTIYNSLSVLLFLEFPVLLFLFLTKKAQGILTRIKFVRPGGRELIIEISSNVTNLKVYHPFLSPHILVVSVAFVVLVAMNSMGLQFIYLVWLSSWS